KGFVVVKLEDRDDCDVMETTGVTILPKFKRLANRNMLTKEYLLDMDYTDLLRCATYPPAQDFVYKTLGIRGVPLLDTNKKSGDKFSLFPHQIVTLTWMRNREAMHTSTVNGLVGGIVSLKMGLGKTLTALLHILSRPKGEFPALVVASKTVMQEWKSQGIEKFFGRNIKVLYLHSDFIPKRHIDQLTRADVLKYDIVITTYDVCTQVCKKVPYYEECIELGDEHTLMKGKIAAIHCRTRVQADKPKVRGSNIIYCTPWDLVICDESQRYANPKTNIFKCIMALYGKNKWCLTGTPIRNYDADIWAQLRFCGYKGVNNATDWKRSGVQKMKDHKLNDAILIMNYKDTTIVLPPKSEYFNNVKLTGKHKIYYDWLLGETINTYDEMMRGGCSFACVLAMFTRLRQCAIAPYLTTRESKRKKKKMSKGDLEAEEKMKKRFANSEMFKWLHDKNTDSGIESCKIKKIVEI
nr:SNF2-related protein [Saprospiraceae bacterium]